MYNRLASKYVIRIGGQLLFKGYNPKKCSVFMDGIMVFESNNPHLLEGFVSSTDFDAVIKENFSNYAAIFTRAK